jgi:hypothetical protein
MVTPQENINFAIIGCVSAGKSTFFNAVTSCTFSEMKRKKTTMLPQIYQTTNDKSLIDDIKTIYNKNKKSNDEILEKRENNTFVIERDFKVINHFIDRIPDFVNIEDNYSILDMPGLNCGADTLYYDYIKSTSSNIDIYILVVDVNSALNTTDEINIIRLIIEQIKKNNNGYIHILINKCDDIQYDKSNKIDLGEEELNEMYQRAETIIKKECASIIHNVSWSPICSSKLYIYRGIKNNIDNIDEKQLDEIIAQEVGKSELRKLKTVENKRKFMIGKLSENKIEYNIWMKETGYSYFQESINKTIKKNYDNIIYYHINKDIYDIIYMIDKELHVTIDELNIKLSIINDRINNLKSKVPDNIIKNLENINKYINKQLLEGVNSFSGGTIEICIEYISKIKKYINTLFKIFPQNNQIKEAETAIINKKFELYIKNFMTKFNHETYYILKDNKKLSDEILSISIKNTLANDIKLFSFIIQNFKEQDDKIIKMLISTYTELISKNVNIITFDIFYNDLSLLLKYDKNIDVVFNFTKHFMTRQIMFGKKWYWFELNAVTINTYCSGIQLLYQLYYDEYDYIVTDQTCLTWKNIQIYNELTRKMNKINDLLVLHLNNTKDDEYHSSNENSDNESEISQNDQPPVSETKIPSVSDSDLDSDASDDYDINDQSETVYSKAKKNANKKTRKYMKKTRN